MVRQVFELYVITCTVLFVVNEVGMAYELLKNSVVGFAIKPLNELAPFESLRAKLFTVGLVEAPDTMVPLILLTTDVALFPDISAPIVTLEVDVGVCHTALVPLYVSTLLVVGAESDKEIAYMLPFLNVFASIEFVVPVIVLFVRVSTVARPTSVSDVVGRVKVPVFEILVITGKVRVLFVKISAVARPTRVSVDVGRVKVPVFDIELITGKVRVLFVIV